MCTDDVIQMLKETRKNDLEKDGVYGAWGSLVSLSLSLSLSLSPFYLLDVIVYLWQFRLLIDTIK
jgi:hypothetical protein